MNSVRRCSGRRGAALVEFALVLPLLFLLFLGIVEFALIGHHKLMLVQGARAGARDLSIGRPVDEAVATTIAAAGTTRVREDQVTVEFNAADGGTGAWLPVSDAALGTYNAVPSGRQVRVRIADWPHQLVTGSLFSWLPRARGGVLLLSGEMIGRRE